MAFDPHALRYSARDVAEDLGITLDTLYASRGRRHLQDKLPMPYATKPMLWDGATYRAWRGRFHPSAPAAPAVANDTAPIGAPQTDVEHRDHLRVVYGGQR